MVVGLADDSAEAALGWAKLQGRVGDRLDEVGTELTFAGFTERTLSSGQILVHAAGARQHTMSLTLQFCQYQHPVG